MLVDQLAQAKPALDHRFRGSHYNTEILQLDVQDLQVQALGDPIRISRTWRDGQWVWNERWADLKILGPADPAAPLGAADPLNEDRPYAVIRGGQSYLRSGSTLQGQDVQFNNLPQRTLTALQRGLAGFRWESIRGERIDYDAQGRMTCYQNRQGNRVSLERDAEGRIVVVKDHYGANGLAGYTDPLGQRTTYVLAQRHALYQEACGRTLERWSGATRNWTPVGAVTLNPERGQQQPLQQAA